VKDLHLIDGEMQKVIKMCFAAISFCVRYNVAVIGSNYKIGSLNAGTFLSIMDILRGCWSFPSHHGNN
jgi:hypothetical protein